MAQITAAQVKELRDKTGAGMMECKSALTEANGDLEESIKILRKKGLAAAGKKAGRVTSEGIVHAFVEGRKAVLLEVNSETDFVAKTDEFKKLVEALAKMIAGSSAEDVDGFLQEKVQGDPEGHDVSQLIASKIATMKENINLRRFVRYEADEHGAFGSYIHANGKIGVLIELGANGAGGRDELTTVAKDVAMHIAAAEPRFVGRDEVTQKDLDTEKEIARDQAIKSGKPEAVVEKIVNGKMEKFYGEACLLEQPFIKDDKLTITQLLDQQGKKSGTGFKVKRFSRFKLGEGIEKKESDFASEVMAQAGM
ncbi:MAG TPA: translation elongation factor Ts [Thermoanaerobaculia bacterium]|nr:translation elongation factor Ts [Thermoanaerobaculia bacterium]